MELTFTELRTKEVVNTQDGKKLGKVCDVALRYPDNRWCGIVVPGSRFWGIKKTELFIELKNIVKIGEDVILVNVGPHNHNEKNAFASQQKGCNFLNTENRNYEEFE